MKTDELIAELASQATPVRPLAAPSLRAAGWVVLAIACGVSGMFVYGPRPDLGELVTRSRFLADTILTFATMILAAWTALVLAVPGAERSSVLRAASIASVLVWLGAISAGTIEAGIGLAGRSDWYICFVRVISVGFVPGIVVTAMLRRAAPLERAWTAGLAATAAMAAGALVMPFVCPVDDAGHALLGHAGPIVLMAAAAVLTAEVAIRRRR